MAELSCNLDVPFSTKREAEIVYNSLRVDKEPKKGGNIKTLSVNGTTLHVHFESKEARLLRVAVNGFMDHLILVTQTIQQFGPPQDKQL